ncbi:MAG: RNA ligase family protein [Clostridiales bacterium]|nr:RNA ligase family protein [Clostridiales bacterium]
MFYKFPSTPYIEIDTTIKRTDKILSEKELDIIFSKEIIVEEKIDGANLGISFDANGELRLQNRGEYILSPYLGQWKKLNDWLIKHENNLFDVLTNEYILFGEWCYARHSVYYASLPDWFIGFDIYDLKNNRFLSVSRRNEYFIKMGIVPVPQLGRGKYSPKELPSFFGISKFGKELCEGIYIRHDKDGYLEQRAKMVRKEFRQNINEHWSRGILQCNQLSCKS